jgi:hypothetical protein
MYQQQQQHFLPTTTTFVPIQNLPPPSQRPRPQQQNPNPKQPATPRVAAAKRSKKKGSSSLCSVNSQGMAIAKISKNNPSAGPKKLFGGKSKAQVLKRNARERNRVQNMNGQYVELACQVFFFCFHTISFAHLYFFPLIYKFFPLKFH